jgi:hypothetical protein
VGAAGASGGASLTTGARMWTNPAADGAGRCDSVPPVSAAAAAVSPGVGALVCGGAADGSTASAEGSSCRLQIKATDGTVACVLEMAASATLAMVHAALVNKAVVGAGVRCELRTAFPARALTDVNRTLAELGLAPSATLCVRLGSGT